MLLAASPTRPKSQRGGTHGNPRNSRQTRPIALIVEDDPIVRELAAALLEESDLRVVECEDAEQAFGTLVRDGDDVALIFADIRLPGLLDGVDLALRVKVLWPQITMVVTIRLSGRRGCRRCPRTSSTCRSPGLRSTC